MRGIWVALAVACAGAPAAAQVTSHAPEWARPLLVTDLDALRVNQATLVAPEGGIAVRLSVAPVRGGVARLIRYDSSATGAAMGVRRYTGHIRNGWVLWGAEQFVPVAVDAAHRAQIDRLAKAALSAALLAGEGSEAGAATCADGDYAWLEVSDPGRASVFERRCVMDGTSGALIKVLIDAAGAKDEEALYQSGIAELMTADRAFAHAARTDGLPAAMATWAAEDGRAFPAGALAAVGKDAISAQFAGRTAGDVLQWVPAGADMAARGDMGFSWGRWTLTRAAGETTTGNYVSVWRRGADGAWRYAANIAN